MAKGNKGMVKGERPLGLLFPISYFLFPFFLFPFTSTSTVHIHRLPSTLYPLPSTLYPLTSHLAHLTFLLSKCFRAFSSTCDPRA